MGLKIHWIPSSISPVAILGANHEGFERELLEISRMALHGWANRSWISRGLETPNSLGMTGSSTRTWDLSLAMLPVPKLRNIGLPQVQRAQNALTYNRFSIFLNRSVAASSVSCFLQKANRTCCDPSRGSR